MAARFFPAPTTIVPPATTAASGIPVSSATPPVLMVSLTSPSARPVPVDTD
jgi:hypothetical protein